MSTDVWLEPEFWADFGELDEVEKNELFILTNDIFTISPKKGRLDPGSFATIIFTHKLVVLHTTCWLGVLARECTKLLHVHC